MTTLASAPARVNPSNITLTDTPQVVTARHAAGFIRRARYVGLIVTTGPGGAWEIFDAPKRRVLRMVRRRDRVWISEVFGTVLVRQAGELRGDTKVATAAVGPEYRRRLAFADAKVTWLGLADWR
jgi:hypothetical protein